MPLTLPARLRRLLPGLATANPFELYLIALIILGGLPLLLGGPAPLSMAALLSRFWSLLWGLELVVGGLTKLVGVLRGRVRYRIAGLWLLGFSSVAYALAIAASLTPGSLVALGFILGFSVACFAQIRHLHHAVRVLSQYQARVTNGGPP